MIGDHPPPIDGCYAVPDLPGAGMTLNDAVVRPHSWRVPTANMILERAVPSPKTVWVAAFHRGHALHSTASRRVSSSEPGFCATGFRRRACGAF